MAAVVAPPTPPGQTSDEYVESDLGDFRLDGIASKAGGIDAVVPLRRHRYERKLGESELSYFLPSQQGGINDMYLHLGFKTSERLVSQTRVCTVWAILRVRHPMLGARVEMRGDDDAWFIYDAPASAKDAYMNADANLEYRTQSKEELIDEHLNGPRTLSPCRLSYLVISEPPSSPELLPTPPRTPSPDTLMFGGDPISENQGKMEPRREYEMLLRATHFVGDGLAMHQFGNDFFALLAGGKSDDELQDLLRDEWYIRWHVTPDECLPSALEDKMCLSNRRFRRAAAQVDFQLSQQRLVGGQVFTRSHNPERHSIIPTASFSEERTKAILQTCKAHGVSISAALFAAANIAWARMGAHSDPSAPTLIYSALNLRPYFAPPPPHACASYWFLALGYFYVVLPSFLPSDPALMAPTFWLRARQAKEQSTRAAKTPLAASRTLEMAQERGQRARAWAKEDRARERGIWVPAASTASDGLPKESVLPARTHASSAALMGLSMLGNLDGVYKHATFPDADVHTLTTGSRQRHGGMLLLSYTFKGRLSIILGYDSNGFEGDIVDRFWKEVLNCVDDFLG